jgi:hypothetical protein
MANNDISSLSKSYKQNSLDDGRNPYEGAAFSTLRYIEESRFFAKDAIELISAFSDYSNQPETVSELENSVLNTLYALDKSQFDIKDTIRWLHSVINSSNGEVSSLELSVFAVKAIEKFDTYSVSMEEAIKLMKKIPEYLIITPTPKETVSTNLELMVLINDPDSENYFALKDIDNWMDTVYGENLHSESLYEIKDGLGITIGTLRETGYSFNDLFKILNIMKKLPDVKYDSYSLVKSSVTSLYVMQEGNFKITDVKELFNELITKIKSEDPYFSVRNSIMANSTNPLDLFKLGLFMMRNSRKKPKILLTMLSDQMMKSQLP